MSNIEDILNTSNILQQMQIVAVVPHRENIEAEREERQVSISYYNGVESWNLATRIFEAKKEGFAILEKLHRCVNSFCGQAKKFEGHQNKQDQYIVKTIRSHMMEYSWVAGHDSKGNNITWEAIGRAMFWHYIHSNYRFPFESSRKNFYYHKYKAASFRQEWLSNYVFFKGHCKGQNEDIKRVIQYITSVDTTNTRKAAEAQLRLDILNGVLPESIEWECYTKWEQKDGKWNLVNIDTPVMKNCDTYSAVLYCWNGEAFMSWKEVVESARKAGYDKFVADRRCFSVASTLSANNWARWQMVANLGEKVTKYYEEWCNQIEQEDSKEAADYYRNLIRKENAKASKAIERIKEIKAKIDAGEKLGNADRIFKCNFRKQHPAEFEQIFGIKA